VLAKIVFLVNVKPRENIKVHLIQIERSDIKETFLTYDFDCTISMLIIFSSLA